MKKEKLKYGHVGRPTNEEVKNMGRKKKIKIAGIIAIVLFLIGGIFLYFNKDNISFESIMGKSTYNSKMKTVQNSSSYKKITFTVQSSKGGYYYQSSSPDKKKKITTYLLEAVGNSSSRYKLNKIQIFSNGYYKKTITSSTKQLKVSSKYEGKTLALKYFIQSKETGEKYTKYARLYIPINKDITSEGPIASKCVYTKSKKTGFLWPIGSSSNGKPVTTKITNGRYYSSSHLGVDINPNGKSDVPIIASYDGIVYDIGNDCRNTYAHEASYGVYIVLKHNYNGKTIYTIYSYMKCNSIPSNIKKGVKVTAGTKLGIMGNTGNSSGTHLHYEVREHKMTPRKSAAVDPLKYIDSKNPYRGGKLKCN